MFRLNLFGSSLWSKYTPFGGSTLPSSCPECPPIAPYEPCVLAAARTISDFAAGLLPPDGPPDAVLLFDPPASGPCCCALERYVAKLSGRECDGEAGWGAGVWSTDSGVC